MLNQGFGWQDLWCMQHWMTWTDWRGVHSVLCGGQKNLPLDSSRKNPSLPFLVTFLISACHLKAKSVEKVPKWPQPLSMVQNGELASLLSVWTPQSLKEASRAHLPVLLAFITLQTHGLVELTLSFLTIQGWSCWSSARNCASLLPGQRGPWRPQLESRMKSNMFL